MIRLNRVCYVVLTGWVLFGCVLGTAGEPAVDRLSSPTRWAENLPGGPMRVVFLAPYGAQHDSFELMQRFDIDGTVVTMASLDTQGYLNVLAVVGHYWPELWPTRKEIRQNIREAVSAEWEAVVMSQTPSWDKYPEDIRRSILKKVASGRGLMIGSLGGTLKSDIARMGLKLQETRIGADRFTFRVGEDGSYQGHARVYRCGKGRVIHFYATNHPAHGYLLSDSVLQSDFEFSAARAGWFLRRAARPDAPSYLLGTRYVDGGLVAQIDTRLGLSEEGVQITVHRRDTYEKVLDASRKIEPGKPVVGTLPQLPGGKYQAEIRITDREGATLDWDVIRFSVTGDVRLNAFEVDRREDLKPGDRVNCRLEVVGKTAGLQMVARWYDNWGRLLLLTKPRPFSEKMSVTVPTGSLSVLNRLEVTIRSDRGPEAVGSAELLMPENIRPTDFHMLYWKLDVQKRYSPDSWRRRLQWDVLRRDGAADAWAGGYPYVNEARDAALSHLRTVPMSTSLHAMDLEKQLLNEEYLLNREKRVREAARVFRPYNPLGHTLGDENSVSRKPPGRFADTPVVWSKFRKYLRGVYPDLGALNTQWGTNFAAWGKIRFDNEGQMLSSMDNPSAWVDFRMFVTHEFVGVHRRLRQAIREEDPDAWVGWDGVEQSSSYGGQDWWELCRDMEMVNTYHTQYVDQGGYIDQVVTEPGRIRNRLRWLHGGCAVDPVTGFSSYQWPRLAWVPVQTPGRTYVNRIWQPNIVAQQVPVTQIVARQVTRRVPVQICRYVDQRVVRKVPYQVCEHVKQTCTRKESDSETS